MANSNPNCPNPSSNAEKEHVDHEEEIGKLAIRLTNAVVLPLVLKSAIELSVIDIIVNSTMARGSGPLTYLSPSDIAAKIVSKNPEAPALLDRMLRLLASYDILKCKICCKDNGEVERLYAAGALCKFFTKEQDEAGSCAPLLFLHLDANFRRGWDHLSDVVLEGGNAFNRAFGRTLFEYLGDDQRFNREFNQAMVSHSNLVMKKVLEVYKGFEGLKVLVDVGGGLGTTLNLITSKYPEIKGINFDLPHVLADAPNYPELCVSVVNLAGNGKRFNVLGVEHVAGDMFASVPRGDAIMMQRVLHDWSEEQCLKILKNCWEALPSNGKVILVEPILPTVPDNNVSSQITYELDLIMLAFCPPGGKERTQKELVDLAHESGFSGYEVFCSACDCWVMELQKSVQP